MDSNSLPLSVDHLSSPAISLSATLLLQLAQLQAQFIQGQAVRVALTRVLAEHSQASVVLLVDINELDNDAMPLSCSSSSAITSVNANYWSEIRHWPHAPEPKCVHAWLHYSVWPIANSSLVIFFAQPDAKWQDTLSEKQQILTDIIYPMLVAPKPLTIPVPVATNTNNVFQNIVDSFEYMTMIIQVDSRGIPIIAYANDATAKISHYLIGELIGKPIAMLFAQHDKQVTDFESFNDALTQFTGFDGEIKMNRHHDETTIMKVNLFAVNLASETVSVLIAHDISMELQMQQAMSRTQKMQALGQLVGGIAHDFNNILGVLKGNLELMQLKNRQESLDKYLTTAFKACSRGTDLTRRLLQFSRQEQFNAQNCSINEVISGLKDIFDKSLTAQVQIAMEFGADLDDICVDRGDLEDAMLNMTINARDAMEGVGALTIRTGQEWLGGKLPGSLTDTQVKSGHYVWISVKDTGCGIPLHLVEKIYEPFFTMKDKSKGTGLGLSMIYGFVKRSHGYMSVVDTGPHGTEFKMWFPAQEKKAHQAVIDTDTNLLHYPKVMSPFKVLIVDDEPEIVAVVQDYCEMLGMTIETCTDPVTVSRKYSGGNCDAQLLITDVLMPGGLNGYNLAQNLQENNPSLSVLLISGYIHDIGISKQKEMPYPVLNKPFDIKGLIKAMLKLGIKFTGVDDKDESWKS